MKRIFTISVIVVIGFLMSTCKKEFLPPEITIDYNYLVVDGVILQSADSPTVFHLSRTRKLTDTVMTSPERNADVEIEGEDGSRFRLPETTAGNYQNVGLVNLGTKYRVNITTIDGKQYLSDYVEVKRTPPIDSISYRQPSDLSIYVSTHDPANATRYYRWEYVETSQYHAIGQTDLGVSNNRIFFRDSTNQIYNCWHISNSTNIYIASTIAYTNDVVSDFPLLVVPKDDERIGLKYSLLVKQYAINREAFSYLQLLQKNSEQQGSIFDEQPSQLKGNIYSVSNPDQPVIGFVTASSVEEKRIFIRNDQLDHWDRLNLDGSCDTVVLAINPATYLDYTYPDPRYVPWYFTGQGFIEVLAEIPCVDCRVRGGTNQKPKYW